MRFCVATSVLIGYYVVGLFVLPSILRRALPTELVRKLQHVVYGASVFLMLETFGRPQAAIAAGAVLVLLGYPFLKVLDRLGWTRDVLVTRAGGGSELRRQMLLVQGTFAIVLIVFWGALGDASRRWAAAAVMVWTVGDAAAALVGRAWGWHLVGGRWSGRGKTWEGVIAMTVGSWVAVAVTLGAYVGTSALLAGVAATVIAPAAAAAELFSRRGMDTVVVPMVATLLLLPFAYLHGAGIT